MRIGGRTLCGVLLTLTFIGDVALAANSFAGSNLYYAAGLYEDDAVTLLE